MARRCHKIHFLENILKTIYHHGSTNSIPPPGLKVKHLGSNLPSFSIPLVVAALSNDQLGLELVPTNTKNIHNTHNSDNTHNITFQHIWKTLFQCWTGWDWKHWKAIFPLSLQQQEQSSCRSFEAVPIPTMLDRVMTRGEHLLDTLSIFLDFLFIVIVRIGIDGSFCRSVIEEGEPSNGEKRIIRHTHPSGSLQSSMSSSSSSLFSSSSVFSPSSNCSALKVKTHKYNTNIMSN